MNTLNVCHTAHATAYILIQHFPLYGFSSLRKKKTAFQYIVVAKETWNNHFKSHNIVLVRNSFNSSYDPQLRIIYNFCRGIPKHLWKKIHMLQWNSHGYFRCSNRTNFFHGSSSHAIFVNAVENSSQYFAFSNYFRLTSSNRQWTHDANELFPLLNWLPPLLLLLLLLVQV